MPQSKEVAGGQADKERAQESGRDGGHLLHGHFRRQFLQGSRNASRPYRGAREAPGLRLDSDNSAAGDIRGPCGMDGRQVSQAMGSHLVEGAGAGRGGVRRGRGPRNKLVPHLRDAWHHGHPGGDIRSRAQRVAAGALPGELRAARQLHNQGRDDSGDTCRGRMRRRGARRAGNRAVRPA